MIYLCLFQELPLQNLYNANETKILSAITDTLSTMNENVRLLLNQFNTWIYLLEFI